MIAGRRNSWLHLNTDGAPFQCEESQGKGTGEERAASSDNTRWGPRDRLESNEGEDNQLLGVSAVRKSFRRAMGMSRRG